MPEELLDWSSDRLNFVVAGPWRPRLGIAMWSSNLDSIRLSSARTQCSNCLLWQARMLVESTPAVHYLHTAVVDLASHLRACLVGEIFGEMVL